MENLIKQLTLIKDKYEKLGFTDSIVYSETCSLLKSEKKLAEIASVLSSITNGEKIFNIAGKLSGKLPCSKNDEIVLSSLAEYDTGRWLVSGFIEGKYDEVIYNPASLTIKLPDYKVRTEKTVKPVETKIISPEDVEENKAVRKIIEKVNSSAIPQLESFATQEPFTQAMVFIWTHKPIEFSKISYSQLKEIFKKDINKRSFRLVILVIRYDTGLWDFDI